MLPSRSLAPPNNSLEPTRRAGSIRILISLQAWPAWKGGLARLRRAAHLEIFGRSTSRFRPCTFVLGGAMKTPRKVHCACLIPSMAILALVACGSSPTAMPQAARESAPFPLSEPGPYHAGWRRFAFEDPSRDNRPVTITVWYPALEPAGSTSRSPTRDAAPDHNGAPYPLILSSTKVAAIFAPYLELVG